MSVALQMLANGGDAEGLFHGAFMQSGAPLLVGDLTVGQKYYDALVVDTGCSGAADTLECLRQVPLSKLKPIVDSSPSIFSYQVRGGAHYQFPARTNRTDLCSRWILRGSPERMGCSSKLLRSSLCYREVLPKFLS